MKGERTCAEGMCGDGGRNGLTVSIRLYAQRKTERSHKRRRERSQIKRPSRLCHQRANHTVTAALPGAQMSGELLSHAAS